MLVIRTAKQWYHLGTCYNYAKVRDELGRAVDICNDLLQESHGELSDLSYGNIQVGSCASEIGGSCALLFACFGGSSRHSYGVTPYLAVLQLLARSSCDFQHVLHRFRAVSEWE